MKEFIRPHVAPAPQFCPPLCQTLLTLTVSPFPSENSPSGFSNLAAGPTRTKTVRQCLLFRAELRLWVTGSDLFEDLDSANGVPQGGFVHNSEPPLPHLKGGRKLLSPSMHLFIRPAHQPTGPRHLCQGRLKHGIAISISITSALFFRVCVCVCVT